MENENNFCDKDGKCTCDNVDQYVTCNHSFIIYPGSSPVCMYDEENGCSNKAARAEAVIFHESGNNGLIKKITMTDRQEKAFKTLQRAVKRCQKENVLFYQVIDTITGMNGDNICMIHDGCGGRMKMDAMRVDVIAGSLSSVTMENSWPDEPQYVELYGESVFEDVE